MKTIIWDYNGTILNDVGIAVRIENEMLEERGLKAGYSIDEYKALFDNPMENYYRKIGYTFENESFHDVGIEFYQLYDKYFPACSLNQGIEEKLKESIQKGYQNIILSSCEHTKLVEQCQKLNIAQYFQAVIGVNNLIGGSKIANGRQWMKETHSNPKDCIFIGDTNADYETANQLGIEEIYLVSTGHQSFARLKKLHNNVITTVKEIKL